ncbi:GMC family oxidoreductase N-terminal domain-containing protein [Elusimicrobiota bacterium]
MTNNPINMLRDISSGSLHCEYLVIGSGAGGAVAGFDLARAGREVVVLEEGELYSAEHFKKGIGKLTSLLYRGGGVTPFLGRPPVAFVEGCCVGGGTLINGGLVWRTPRRVLDQWRKEFGLIGYGYEDLEPHFKKIEELLNVTYSQTGDHDIDSAVIKQACDSLGWKNVPVPRAVKDCKHDNRCPTGCASSAKISVVESYLSEASRSGARVLAGYKAIRIIPLRSGQHEIHCAGAGPGAGDLKIISDRVVLAGGATQTPFLLRKSNISKTAGRKLWFHINIKVVATFDQRINASNGTMFTVQVQEFEDEGLLMMASNWQPHYMAATLSHLGSKAIDDVLRDYDRSALYVAQVRAKSLARVMNVGGNAPFVWYQLDKKDIPAVHAALSRLGNLLFAAGAKTLYLPLSGSSPVHSMQELESELNKSRISDFKLVSMHAMGSCSMGGPDAVIAQDGTLAGHPGIMVADASALPSNIGESPQGTIMAFAHEIMKRHIK